MKYWLSAHNGVAGVAGSNPVAPTFFIGSKKKNWVILYPTNVTHLFKIIFRPQPKRHGGMGCVCKRHKHCMPIFCNMG